MTQCCLQTFDFPKYIVAIILFALSYQLSRNGKVIIVAISIILFFSLEVTVSLGNKLNYKNNTKERKTRSCRLYASKEKLRNQLFICKN